MIRRQLFLIVNSIIIVFIIIAYLFIQMGELSFYKEMAFSEAADDVALTASEINSELSTIASEQIIVAKTIANDIYIREWARREDGSTNGEEVYKLLKYLLEYRIDFGFDSVFFVSEATRNYYYDGGYYKTLDSNDEHDSWYEGFKASYSQFNTQIDTDELNNDKISLYVDYLVQDNGFKTLGVVGISKNIEPIGKKIMRMEQDYDVKMCLVNVGDIYNSFDGSFEYYKRADEAAEYMGLSEEQVTREVKGNQSYSWIDGNKCYNIVYNTNLGWNIIVEKDITSIMDNILGRTYRRTGGMIIMILLYTIVSFTLLARLSTVSRHAENVDDLTILYNNKVFKELFEKNRRRQFKKKQASLFMVDIDDFKQYNDNYGHLYGNYILKLVADTLKSEVKKEGIIARWGGDEFIGYIFADTDETMTLLSNMRQCLKNTDTYKTVTCSCGIVAVDGNKDLEKNMDMADEALYESKAKGKDCCTIYKG